MCLVPTKSCRGNKNKTKKVANIFAENNCGTASHLVKCLPFLLESLQ